MVFNKILLAFHLTKRLIYIRDSLFNQYLLLVGGRCAKFSS